MKIKHLWLKLGITLLMAGIIMLVFSFSQCKINVNAMTIADWQNTHIKSIGIQTEAKIIKSCPVKNVNDLAEINGIGKVKSKTLERHFCAYDTCRFEIDVGFAAGGAVCSTIGILLIVYILTKRKILSDDLKECIKKGK